MRKERAPRVEWKTVSSSTAPAGGNRNVHVRLSGTATKDPWALINRAAVVYKQKTFAAVRARVREGGERYKSSEEKANNKNVKEEAHLLLLFSPFHIVLCCRLHILFNPFQNGSSNKKKK